MGSLGGVTHSSPLGCEDVRPRGEVHTIRTSREGLEHPLVTESYVPLQDGVDHVHVSPRELVDSPKGARDSASRPFPFTHVDMQESSAAAQVPPDNLAFNHAGVVNLTDIVPHEGSDIQVASNIHSSVRIQQDLDLWRRVKEYDKKTAAEPFLPVLTRQQKLHLKKTTSGKPTSTRSTGSKSTSHQ